MKSLLSFHLIALLSISAFAFSSVLNHSEGIPVSWNGEIVQDEKPTLFSDDWNQFDTEIDKMAAIAFPNPMMSNSLISYELVRDSKVVLTLFDCQGRLISELLNENQLVGVQKYFLERNGLKAGLYFLNIKSAYEVVSISIAVVD